MTENARVELKIASLDQAMGRGPNARDMFAEDAEGNAHFGNGQFRAALGERLRKIMVSGDPGEAILPSLNVSAEAVQRLATALRQQARNRNTTVGRQAYKLLTRLEDGDSGERVAGLDLRQLRKFLRKMDRDSQGDAPAGAGSDAEA